MKWINPKAFRHGLCDCVFFQTSNRMTLEPMNDQTEDRTKWKNQRNVVSITIYRNWTGKYAFFVWRCGVSVRVFLSTRELDKWNRRFTQQEFGCLSFALSLSLSLSLTRSKWNVIVTQPKWVWLLIRSKETKQLARCDKSRNQLQYQSILHSSEYTRSASAWEGQRRLNGLSIKIIIKWNQSAVDVVDRRPSELNCSFYWQRRGHFIRRLMWVKCVRTSAECSEVSVLNRSLFRLTNE